MVVSATGTIWRSSVATDGSFNGLLSVRADGSASVGQAMVPMETDSSWYLEGLSCSGRAVGRSGVEIGLLVSRRVRGEI